MEGFLVSLALGALAAAVGAYFATREGFGKWVAAAALIVAAAGGYFLVLAGRADGYNGWIILAVIAGALVVSIWLGGVLAAVVA